LHTLAVKFSQQYAQSQVSLGDDDCTPSTQPVGQHPPPMLFQPMCDRYLPHEALHAPDTNLKSGLGPHWHWLLELQTCDHGQSPSHEAPHPSSSPQDLPEQSGEQQTPDLQEAPEEQVQDRLAPHPSETVPHLLPQPLGSQPHLFATPAPPQVFGAAQLPQSTAPPQPSGRLPHSAPALEHDGFGHPQRPGWPPPPHVEGAGHAPQLISSEQPSDTSPHAPGVSEQSFAVHGEEPQRFGPPPPQTVPPMHLPQGSTPPQPSGRLPHCAPSCRHVSGTQPPLSAPVSAASWREASAAFEAVASPLSPHEPVPAAMKPASRILSVAWVFTSSRTPSHRSL